MCWPFTFHPILSLWIRKVLVQYKGYCSNRKRDLLSWKHSQSTKILCLVGFCTTEFCWCTNRVLWHPTVKPDPSQPVKTTRTDPSEYVYSNRPPICSIYRSDRIDPGIGPFGFTDCSVPEKSIPESRRLSDRFRTRVSPPTSQGFSDSRSSFRSLVLVR